ncbi:hypothetical protein SAMN02910298_02941 [Pseudobutyrivibrio sp. YE44]|uniref:hypothetical protein n=1 Tax=Pseudobutyrivibrio sp. YE44 TaxID=1520802 RepID=UPI0008803202|nr:hypothetical protein [Pseudobutyrivibrio sp. YE44]SDB57031.1 hypothetical protein SAMN02910298_02941 [Pseudobutyrivibrio sp. YE44]
MTQILETTIYYVQKIGIIYSMCWIFWICFLIAFVGLYFSSRNFRENCLPSKAIVNSYCRDTQDGSTVVYVRIPEINEVCSVRAGAIPVDDYPVGSEVDVLYLKCLVGYDVRAANYQDGWLLWLFFIFQALPIVAMVGLRIYSTFIDPSFHVI